METVQREPRRTATDCYSIDFSRQYRRFSRSPVYYSLRWIYTEGGHKIGHSRWIKNECPRMSKNSSIGKMR
jgi:hypothetical protein